MLGKMQRTYKGFSLLELLGVLGVCVCFLALLIPMLHTAKGKVEAFRTHAILQAQAYGLWAYYQEYRQFSDFMPQDTRIPLKDHWEDFTLMLLGSAGLESQGQASRLPVLNKNKRSFYPKGAQDFDRAFFNPEHVFLEITSNQALGSKNEDGISKKARILIYQLRGSGWPPVVVYAGNFKH